MHATLQVAAVLYIEALEMQLVSMYVCVCLPPVYMGGEVLSSHFVSVYGGGGGCVTVVILSVHMGRGYRLGAFEYTD